MGRCDAGFWQAKEDDIFHGQVPAANMVKKYEYDLRGNLTAEYQNGSLIHGYEYNAMNRLAKSWNRQGSHISL